MTQNATLSAAISRCASASNFLDSEFSLKGSKLLLSCFHATELSMPLVESSIAETTSAANIRHLCSSFCYLQETNNLLFITSTPLWTLLTFNWLGKWGAGQYNITQGQLQKTEHTVKKIDDTFSENHGTLTVLAAMQAILELAQTEAQIVLRLDRESFAGNYARALIAQASGANQQANQIIAVCCPV